MKTLHGAAYLKRLCRHFAHKIPANIEGERGTLEFPFGICVIDVDDEAMHFRIRVDNSVELDRAENVVAGHLIRMANRDRPVVVWTRTS
ncbi:MAG: DUF2218 domain-containing protein [Burkholderiales bacterium]|nr:DUF2218 domain-containing protein [Burkholderiales bacterium]